MKGPEHFGENMSNKKGPNVAFEVALQRLKDRLEVQPRGDTKALELSKHGITPPLQVTHTHAPTLLKPKFVPAGAIPIPPTLSKKFYTEVSQPELIRNEDGQWIRKDEEQ